MKFLNIIFVAYYKCFINQIKYLKMCALLINPTRESQMNKLCRGVMCGYGRIPYFCSFLGNMKMQE